MYNIDTATSVGAMPAMGAQGPANWWSSTGPNPTIPSEDWFNGVQAELLNILTAAGVAPQKNVLNQVLTSIFTLIGQGYMAASRIRLSAPLELYVNASTGSDANNGLTAATPFATTQHAWNVLFSNYDLNGYAVTIKLADGTYTAGTICSGRCVGQSDTVAFGAAGDTPQITFLGDTAAPGNVIIDTPTGNCFSVGNGTSIAISGMTLEASSNYANAGNGILTFQCGYCFVGPDVIFGACHTAQINAVQQSQVYVSTNYAIAGGGKAHLAADGCSVILINGTGITVTISGTPAYSVAFAQASVNSGIEAPDITFGGTGATGSYYNVSGNACISTGGGGAAYFPGNSAGTAANGGQYF